MRKLMINILEMESSKGWGGQEKRTVRVVNNLSKTEFKVYWAVEKNSELYRRKNAIDAIFAVFNLKRIYNIKTIISLCKFVKENKINIISTHSGKDSWIGNIVGLLTKTKVVRVRHLILPIKNPYSYNLATKVVTVSKQLNSYLESAGVKKNKLINIYTGVDINKFTPEVKKDLHKELNLDKDILLVGIVAVLRIAKRHKMLIKAFSKIDNINAKLLIIGDGPHKVDIKNFIEDNNLEDKVIMLGHRDDIDKILPSLDIFCLPSSQEALGTSLLEAQACGIPVIGTNIDGIPEALENNKTGYLFNNDVELKEKLEKLLKDNKIRKEFSFLARKFIEESFSVQIMIKKTEALYKELI